MMTVMIKTPIRFVARPRQKAQRESPDVTVWPVRHWRVWKKVLFFEIYLLINTPIIAMNAFHFNASTLPINFSKWQCSRVFLISFELISLTMVNELFYWNKKSLISNRIKIRNICWTNTFYSRISGWRFFF